MACDPQTFTGVAPSSWTFMKSEVQRVLGIAVAADSGEAAAKGFTLRWAYAVDEQTLTLTCVDKPFFAPCGMINDQIAKLVDAARSR